MSTICSLLSPQSAAIDWTGIIDPVYYPVLVPVPVSTELHSSQCIAVFRSQPGSRHLPSQSRGRAEREGKQARRWEGILLDLTGADLKLGNFKNASGRLTRKVQNVLCPFIQQRTRFYGENFISSLKMENCSDQIMMKQLCSEKSKTVSFINILLLCESWYHCIAYCHSESLEIGEKYCSIRFLKMKKF